MLSYRLACARRDRAVSRQLCKLREIRGLTQRQVSDLTGISTNCLSHYENGWSTPCCEALVRLAVVYGVSLDTLLDR